MKEVVAILGVNSFSGSTFTDFLLRHDIPIVGFARTTSTDEIFLPYRGRFASGAPKLELFESNLTSDYNFIAETILNRGIRYVFNFAAQSMVAESWITPADWYDVNVSAFSRLLTRINSSKSSEVEKFINFSTPEVYGSTPGLIKESWNFNPTTPYAISRSASDLHLRALNQSFGFPVILTRTANIYGRGQRLYRLIPRLIVQILKGEKFELHGGGKSVRAFIHSDDVAEALWKVMQSGQIGDTYHISSERFISIFDLVILILEKLNANFDKHIIIHEERMGKDQAYLLDSTKIRSELGWVDRVTLESGIDQVIKWVIENWMKIERMDTNYTHMK